MSIKTNLILLSMSALVSTSALADASRVALCTSPAGSRHDLRYSLVQGTAFKLELFMDRNVKQRNLEGDASASIRSTTLLDAVAGSVDADGLKIALTFRRRLYMSGNATFGDTTNFSGVEGKRVSVSLSSSGMISSFEGIDSLPAVLIRPEKRVFRRQDYFNDLVDAFPQLPPVPVGVGDSWFYETMLSDRFVAGQIGLKCGYKYTVLADTVIAGQNCLKCLGEFTLKGRGQGLDEMTRIRLDVDLSGTGTDTLLFAYDNGMVLERNTHTSVSGTAFNSPLRFATDLNYVTHNRIRFTFD